MKISSIYQMALLGITLAATSCSNYSKVSERRLSYRSSSAAGQAITQALNHPSKDPRENIGHYLDAVAAANGRFHHRAHALRHRCRRDR